MLGKLPKHGQLHEVLMASEELTSKNSVPDKLPERGWLKGDRIKGLREFGKKNSHGSPCLRPDVLRDARGAHGVEERSVRLAYKTKMVTDW